MDFIDQMLHDDEILSRYNAIDKDNHTPSSHGMKHVAGVVVLADKLGKLFEFSEREMLILKTIEPGKKVLIDLEVGAYTKELGAEEKKE